MNFQHLSDVHTGRHAQGVQNHIQRSAIRQEGHILLRQHPGHNALVTVTAGHLIAHRNLTLLGDVNPDGLGNAGSQVIGILLGEHLHIHHDTAFAVGHLQRGIPHLSGLLAKDGPEQPLLGGQLGLALGGNLTHQVIAGMNLGTNPDDTVLVQVLQGVLTHIGNIPGDFLRSQLGIPGFGLVLFNMDGGEHILTNQPFVQQDGVLVVVTFPGNEANEHVLTQGNLTAGAGGAVRNNLLVLYPLPYLHNGTLVDASAGIAPGELGQLVGFAQAVVIADGDGVGGDGGNGTVAGGLHTDLGVHSGGVLNTCSHDGGLGGEQRHSLTLHVSTHQGTVGVVVLQEGNKRGSDGNHHSGGHVDVVDHVLVHGDDFVSVTAGDTVVLQAAVLIQGLIGLADVELVFHIRSHVLHLVGHLTGGLVHLPVGGFHEAVLVDLGKGSQVVNQADVGTFRGLDGAHTAVVGVVNITNIEGCSLTAQTAGAQSGQTALVGQLSQGVVLVHELRQGGGAEELLDHSGHRTDVDQALGGHCIQILDGHPLPDYPVQTAEANAELVLQQLAHAAQTAVAQVVNVVGGTDAHGHTVQVVDGGHDVIHHNVLGDELIHPLLNGFLPAIGGNSLQHFLQHPEANLLLDAVFLGIKVHKAGHVHHAVGEHLDLLVAHLQDGFVHALGGQLHSPGTADDLAGHCQNLAGHGIGDGLCQLLARQPGPDVHLLVELVTAHRAYIVAVGVKQQGIQVGSSGLHRGRLAGTEAPVDFQQTLFPGLAGILFNGGKNPGILAEHGLDLLVRIHAQGPDQAGNGQLPVLVDANPENIGKVGLILQPGTPIGNHRGGVGVLVGLVHLVAIVHTGRTDNLGDDDTLGTIDHKGTAVGHNGEISHEDLLLLDFVGLGVPQADPHLDGPCVGSIPLLALLDGVLGLVVHGVIQEAQLKLAGEISNDAYILENLPEAFIQEPLIGVLLNLQHVRHLQDFLILCVALTQSLAKHLVFDHCHIDHHSLSFGRSRNHVFAT